MHLSSCNVLTYLSSSTLVRYIFFIACTFSSSAEKTSPSYELEKPCPAQLQPTSPCAPCSLKQWTKKINTLKERPIQFSSLPKKRDYQKNILSFKEFFATVHTCNKVIVDSLKTDAQWLNKKSLITLAPEISDLDRPCNKCIEEGRNFTFKPYSQRLVTKPGTIFALFGDLHGSIHSFLRDLKALQDMGYIGDDFKIKKNDFIMIFLGDYIDRGIYGVEVLYTVARLKIANPSKVILVRGNHEDHALSTEFKNRRTKNEKENVPSFVEELHTKFDLVEKDEIAIFRLYDLFPVALYIGSGTKEHKDFMMCCHGGLEIGYDPYNLLHANEPITFEFIERIWRKRNFTKKLSKNLQNSIKLIFDMSTLCAEIADFVPPAPFFYITPDYRAYVGFMWHAFIVDPIEIMKQPTNITGAAYGKQLAKEILSWGCSPTVTLQGVLRGHQHNNDTGPMLNLLCCKKGIITVWEHEHVYTLLSAPNSKLDKTGEQCFTYDSFVLLTTAQKFSDWRFKHYYSDFGQGADAYTKIRFHVSQQPLVGQNNHIQVSAKKEKNNNTQGSRQHSARKSP